MTKVKPRAIGGWNQWSRHVIEELERLNENIEKLIAITNKNATDIAVLKFKAGVLGLIGGLVPSAIMLLVLYFKS